MAQKVTSLTEIADQFLAQVRAGHGEPIEVWAERFDSYADEIHELFPTLLQLEQLDVPVAEPAPTLDDVSLTDYDLIAEIGRGGMGVVYKAWQKTLKRFVAIKLVSNSATDDPQHFARFQREASAAARLHHTNIVPVFEVGTSGSTHFYSMQLIEGQNLNDVLLEARRIAKSNRGPLQLQALDKSTHAVAQSSSVRVKPSLLPAVEAPNYLSTEQIRPDVPEQPLVGSDTVGDRDDNSGRSSARSSARDRGAYYRQIAQIGLQATEAVAYAHSRGVLHRDIKPSNMILDAHGTIWLADFGLAKIMDDNLTQSGDIVGTLRYMSPERFRGQVDERSDIYSLGLTLYECVAMRPAFEETDRARLVDDVLRKAPERLRTSAPDLPRDLETIILRAAEKSPSQRYQTARQLADDLRRFLDDRPILARRTSQLEHAWRWCRKNPATTTLALLFFCATLLGLAIFAYAKYRIAADAESNAEYANHQLVETYLRETRLVRTTGRPGQRTDGLRNLTAAAQLLPKLRRSDAEQKSLKRQLVDEAIRCLSVPDVKAQRGPDFPLNTRILAASADLQYAISRQGTRTVLTRLSDGRRSVLLEGVFVEGAKFSPDGSHFALKTTSQTRAVISVWNLKGKAPLTEIATTRIGNGFGFLHNTPEVVVSHPARGIGVFRIADGEYVRSYAGNSKYRAFAMSVSPDDRYVAIARFKSVGVSVLSRGAARHTFSLGLAIRDLDWSFDSRFLCYTTSDGFAYVWQVDPAKLRYVLNGHHGDSLYVRFSPSHLLLATEGQRRRLQLWDAGTGRRLLALRGVLVGFDNRNQLGLLMPESGKLSFRRLSLLNSAEFRSVSQPLGLRHIEESVVVHPGGKLVAWSTIHGVRLLNSADLQTLVSLHEHSPCHGAEFLPDGSLLTSGDFGLSHWPLTINGNQLTIGTEKRIINAPCRRLSLSKDGRYAVVACSERAEVVVIDLHSDGYQHVFTRKLKNAARPALSPDGRWLALTGFRTNMEIWNVPDRRRVKTISKTLAGYDARFSPDGDKLISGTPSCYNIWDVGKWELSATLSRNKDTADETAPVAFDPSGKVVALCRSRDEISLVELSSNKELVKLATPNNRFIKRIQFGPSTRSIIACTEDHVLDQWNLAQIDRSLTEIGLSFESVRQHFRAPTKGPVITSARFVDSP